MLLILVAGTLVYAFLKDTTDFVHAALYSSLPSFLVWLMLFGVVLNRYERYCVAACAWEEASAETRFQW
ncbi:hypothetical protein [Photorhabdus khanii]|uniref:hypothetical protein n=1 Tax=Photorhabdus khanii TaxID=1004150 RepID=UPI001F528A2C|nr:hypothetical protein [Photorhabdus khanii]